MNNIKRVPNIISIKEYLINFTYYKRNGKYAKSSMTIKHINKESAKETFKAWCKKQRTMSNVSILDIERLNSEPMIIEV